MYENNHKKKATYIALFKIYECNQGFKCFLNIWKTLHSYIF